MTHPAPRDHPNAATDAACGPAVDPAAPLLARFEAHRPALRAAAYRMLGSAAEADDAVQEAWLRLGRAAGRGDVHAVESLEAWLTTVVARVCLDALRARAARREQSLEALSEVPQQATGRATAADAPRAGSPPAGSPPAGGRDALDEAQLADAVGLALLVVLDRLAPAERVAFVLHDVFDLPFEAIAPVVARTPAAARQLASRARRRVRGTPPRHAAALRSGHAADRARQRAVVEAYLAASRAGDVAGLLAVLAPDVVLRVDAAALPPGAPADAPREVRGAEAVAGRALAFAGRAPAARAALVDGAVGVVVAPHGQLAVLLRVTVADVATGPRITALEVVGDPSRLRACEIALLDA